MPHLLPPDATELSLSFLSGSQARSVLKQLISPVPPLKFADRRLRLRPLTIIDNIQYKRPAGESLAATGAGHERLTAEPLLSKADKTKDILDARTNPRARPSAHGNIHGSEGARTILP